MPPHTAAPQSSEVDIPEKLLVRFQDLIARLFQCCQERMQYQTERFGLPDAELRCLTLFTHDRYLTPKGIAVKMNVVKSRVTKIIDGLVKKGLVYRMPAPEDSRIRLIGLTSAGQKKLSEINEFMSYIHREALACMHPDDRRPLVDALDRLRISMESTKELMT